MWKAKEKSKERLKSATEDDCDAHPTPSCHAELRWYRNLPSKPYPTELHIHLRRRRRKLKLYITQGRTLLRPSLRVRLFATTGHKLFHKDTPRLTVAS